MMAHHGCRSFGDAGALERISDFIQAVQQHQAASRGQRMVEEVRRQAQVRSDSGMLLLGEARQQRGEVGLRLRFARNPHEAPEVAQREVDG